MTLRTKASHAKPRWGLLVAVVAIGMIFVVGTAMATPSSDSGFEGADGNLLSNGATDWNSFAPVTWEGDAPYQEAHKTVAPWSFTGVTDDRETTADTAFKGGTKQDHNCAQVIGAKAPNKDDLKRAYFADATVVVGSEEHIFLALAWVRIIQNTTSPSAHVGFEFNQGDVPCGPASDGLVHRTAGDLLIVYDFEGSSTALPTLTLRTWTTTPGSPCEVSSNSAPCWGPAVNLTTGGFAEARVNTTTAIGPFNDELAPVAPENLGTNEFGEAIIDLTGAGIFDPGECVAFGKAFAVSRSSGNSAQAQMKDLAGPGEVNIQNCGSVIIRKVTDPAGDETTNFDYDTTGGLDTETTDPEFSLKDGESKDYGDEVAAGSYTVSERDPGPAYALTDINCDASDTANGSSITIGTDGVDFDLEPEDTIDCTFTNTLQRGALSILKNSTKGGAVANAGAVFSVEGPAVGTSDDFSVTDDDSAAAPDEDADVGEVCVSGLLPGDYTVNETSPPTGYAGAPASDADQTVTVVAGTDCTDNLPAAGATATFTNAPLADIQVRFRDGGSGETLLDEDLSCDITTGTASTDDTANWDDTLTISGIPIDNPVVTITCTIKIDP